MPLAWSVPEPPLTDEKHTLTDDPPAVDRLAGAPRALPPLGFCRRTRFQLSSSCYGGLMCEVSEVSEVDSV